MRVSSVIASAFAAALTLAGNFGASAQDDKELVQKFGDWHMYCDKGDAQPRQGCVLKQHTIVGNDSSQFVKITMFPEKDDATEVQFRVAATDKAKAWPYLHVVASGKDLTIPKVHCDETANECLFRARFFQPVTDVFLKASKIGVNIRYDDTALGIALDGFQAAVATLNGKPTPYDGPGIRI